MYRIGTFYDLKRGGGRKFESHALNQKTPVTASGNTGDQLSLQIHFSTVKQRQKHFFMALFVNFKLEGDDQVTEMQLTSLHSITLF